MAVRRHNCVYGARARTYLAELTGGFDIFEPQEFEDLYDQLDSDHLMEVDQSLREVVDSAVGDEHWTSDS